mmetsp:Transcript_26574/g.57660  ORF Transcript_26574/g.57660 Transcript_26574/m.57660 type:complete len:281 (-) Transcript_26574:171-1013(-)
MTTFLGSASKLGNEASEPKRLEASGPGWEEHFVDREQASATCSVGVSVSRSLSYVTISDFATVEERFTLQEAAFEVKRNGSSDGVHILGASEANGNATTRYSVEGLLNRQAKATSAALLDRLLGFLEDGHESSNLEMAGLALAVFGISSNLRQRKATWYGEPNEEGRIFYEPKVNIYEKGGFFNVHEDGMQLTLLVVLSDEFEGGGTAFYQNDVTGQTQTSNDDKHREPQSICRPPMGTAMIWGGALEHMALPVLSGMRSVFVGSFDLGTEYRATIASPT